MNDLDRRTEDLLQVLLGEGSTLIPFTRAVVGHLSGVRRVEPDLVLQQVWEVLSTALEEGIEGPEAKLQENPEILASFFQNADLLDPRAAETAALARLIMSALESLGGRGA